MDHGRVGSDGASGGMMKMEKTENGKPGDRSPAPPTYIGRHGISESFKCSFPDKRLISILNIIALKDRKFTNRAPGRRDNVTACDGFCDSRVSQNGMLPLLLLLLLLLYYIIYIYIERGVTLSHPFSQRDL